MISVIICSRTKNLKKELADNIDATIQVPYELVVIDNSANEHSICAAYNLGVQKSKYDILCFMHDDLIYHTDNWGQRVKDHFKDKNISAIGIAGSPYYPFMPGPWWATGLIYEYILQSSADSSPAVLKDNSNGESKREVVIFDGVWFCIKKTIFTQLSFDEESYKGFHLYDADICLQMHQKNIKIYCVNDVLIHHPSMGNLNVDWIQNDLVLQKKWAQTLPATCINLKRNALARMEYKTLNAFILITAANSYTNSKIYSTALKYLLKFKKGYLFYKTPGYIAKFLFKFLLKKDAPFYS